MNNTESKDKEILAPATQGNDQRPLPSQHQRETASSLEAPPSQWNKKGASQHAEKATAPGKTAVPREADKQRLPDEDYFSRVGANFLSRRSDCSFP